MPRNDPSPRQNNMTAAARGLLLLPLLALIFLGPPAWSQGRVVRITTVPAATTRIEQTEWAVGVIESRVSAQVAAEVSGKVVQVLAEPGQGVAAGQVLAEIETSQYRYGQDADSAEAGRLDALLRSKTLELERARKLVAERLIAAERLDTVQAEHEALVKQVEGARANLAESQRRLGKTRITAPVRAEIADRLVDIGDYVQAGTVAFDLVDIDRLRVKLPFPEYRATEFAPGLKVRLTSVAAGSRPLEASISEVQPSINPANRAITVVIDFDNPGSWRPGASVRADVVLAVRENAIAVPQIAVVRRPVGDVVYVIRDGKAEERPVRRGLRTGATVEILEGLRSGEVVAVDGAGFLTQGVAVNAGGK
ncbi:MAG: efflux RND transporter periplasmic adaptor subunit [Gammaproteobacteria bacterium]|nr:efflux RND transporter periplasmic adaptor subunit [Gammaproteobacteria bacterium]